MAKSFFCLLCGFLRGFASLRRLDLSTYRGSSPLMNASTFACASASGVGEKSFGSEMSTGASDARPFRVAGVPIYGTNGAWVQVPTDFRAHGKDERIPVQSLYDNVVHWQIMLRDLAGK